VKTMARSKELWGVILGVLLCCLAAPAQAQNARLKLEHLEKLGSKAAEVNNVTLDGDMLQLAAKFLDMDKDDPEAAQVKDIIKKLKGIYVKNFEFDEPNQYSAADVEEIRMQLAAPGWSKIIENRDKRNAENNEIYVMKDASNNIAGIAILVAEPKELTVVNIVGPVDLDKLSALSGKFGIPGEKKDKDREQHKKKASAENSDEEG
jgi:Domain of unknown function (DUF4252)